jgi:hypothetical protein
MLRPSVEELVRVKDVDVQMREYLANLRVAVEAGQKGKKKKAKKKPKKKKEKKGKKKKDPTEGRSMERYAAPARVRKHPFLKRISVSTASLLSLASSSPSPPAASLTSKVPSRTQIPPPPGLRATSRRR